MRIASFFAAIAITGTLTGCTHDDAKAVAEAGAPIASHESAYPSGTPIGRPPIRSQPVQKFPCRAIEATNKPALLTSPVAPEPLATADAGVNFLARDMQIPEEDWISLPAGSKVTAKSPRTLRETTYEGAGMVRPCVDHDEEAWVLSGNFTAVSPGNESPGAEEWVVTPLGIIRYVSSSLTVRLGKRTVDVKIAGGNASLLVPSFVVLKDGSDAGSPIIDAGVGTWIRKDGGFSGTLTQTLSDEKIPAVAIAACASAAADTKVIALQLDLPDASIGILGGQHTEARRLARGLCSIARVIVAKLPDDKPGTTAQTSSKTKLQAAIDTAEKDWRTLP
ncbi:MAG: hypothetical protein ABI461_07345 [Polyangiaceae bacterium]